MNDRLNIQNILGNVTQLYQKRASRDGLQFEALIPAPAWTETIVKRDGSVTDTVGKMRKIIDHYSWQAAKVAPLLKGHDLYSTCQNIWNFLYTHIKYKEDEEGKEQLRTFARTWAERLKRGVDCDDFSISAGCLLRCIYPHLPFYIRIAKYDHDYFQHVYIVVPNKGIRPIIIDAVLDHFDTEKKPTETKDFLVMDTSVLNGVNISVLGGIGNDTLNELAGVLSGEDFHETNQMEGLGRIPTREQELHAIRRHLVRTRNLVHRYPHLIKDAEHPATFLGMVDYALKYWDTNKREDALGVLAGEEDRINTLEGLGASPEDHEDVQLFYGVNGMGGYDVLGKAKRQRKFFAKVKQAVKKAGQGIKKVAKALIRFNPLTATIRAAVLLALKVNLFKVGSKLKWGYLTEAEAQKHGFDMAEWRKTKEQLAKAERLFVNTLQGKAENFKRAIITGRAGGLSGTGLSLGFVATAATAASTTAAVPFITKIISLLKNINFKKLIAKVDLPSVRKSRKQAEDDTPTEDGGSSIPENSPDNGGENTGYSSGNNSGGADQSSTNPETTATDTTESTDTGNGSDSGDTSQTDTSGQEQKTAEETGNDSQPGENNNDTENTGEDTNTDNTEPVEGLGDDAEGGDLFSKVKTGLMILNNFKNKAVDQIKKRKKKTGTPQQTNRTATTTPNGSPAANKQNLPVHNASTAPPIDYRKLIENAQKQQNRNPFQKAGDWIKANPVPTVLIGAAVSTLVIGSIMVGRKAKKRRANNSQAVAGIKAGTKKKAHKKSKTKNKSLKGTGRKKSKGKKSKDARRVKL